jgi:RimJ/RimL family protein N-acetyltransferase
MGWVMTEAVEEFLAEAGEFLHAERARNTVMLTVTETLRAKAGVVATGAARGASVLPEADCPPLFGWWRAGGHGPVEGAFMHTPTFPVMLSAMTGNAAAELAGELAATGRTLIGINAAEETAIGFAKRWRDRTGQDAHVHRRMRLFRLGQLVWPEPRPDGEARLATAADRDQLISWFDAFDTDVGDPETDHTAALDDRLSYGGITFWQVGGTPVAMAGVTRTVAGMVRVGPVYTPPELRGRGYAGAATATVSQAALAAGRTDVLLYTDLANPTSNALYQRIGYRPVEDRVVLFFG